MGRRALRRFVGGLRGGRGLLGKGLLELLACGLLRGMIGEVVADSRTPLRESRCRQFAPTRAPSKDVAQETRN